MRRRLWAAELRRRVGSSGLATSRAGLHPPACARSEFRAGLYPLAAVREIVAERLAVLFFAKCAGGFGRGATGSRRLERARDITIRAHRRVLALSFGLDFIHWRRRSRSLAAFSRAREAKPSAAVNRGRALERAAVVVFGKLFLR